MAHGAMWQHHGDRRERLCGTEVTRGPIFICTYIVYDNMYIGLPIIRRHFIDRYILLTLYTRHPPLISSVWD